MLKVHDNAIETEPPGEGPTLDDCCPVCSTSSGWTEFSRSA